MRAIAFLIFAAALLVMLTSVNKVYRTPQRCTDVGGHWERFNCATRTSLRCRLVEYDCMVFDIVCVPVDEETCEERCVVEGGGSCC